MSSELMVRLVNLEDEKHVRDGITRKLALALVHDLEEALGGTKPTADELVTMRHLAGPVDLKSLTKKP